MSGVNKAILVGRLGKDPEVRYLESGVAVANFPIATSEAYKDRTTGERKEQTEWHNIVLWRGLAEVAEKYLKKGDMIYVEGKLKTRSWEKDGVTRYTTEIVGDSMTMLSGKSGGTEGSQQQAAQSTTPSQPAAAEPGTEHKADPPVSNETDDLPF